MTPAIRARTNCRLCGQLLHNEPAPDGTPVWVDTTGGDVCGRAEDGGPHLPDGIGGPLDYDANVACGDCDWFGSERDLEPIQDLAARVAPGEIVPSGECPVCGALAHRCYLVRWDDDSEQAFAYRRHLIEAIRTDIEQAWRNRNTVIFAPEGQEMGVIVTIELAELREGRVSA